MEFLIALFIFFIIGVVIASILPGWVVFLSAFVFFIVVSLVAFSVFVDFIDQKTERFRNWIDNKINGG